MEIRSQSFENNDELPREYTCQGVGAPPPLEWNDLPEGTKSLVLICDDPDAPNGTFYHWGVYNLPEDMTSFTIASGAGGFPMAENDAGGANYYPPCPPKGHGPHNYRFYVWALGVEELRFNHVPTVKELVEKARPHILDEGMIQARFQQ